MLQARVLQARVLQAHIVAGGSGRNLPHEAADDAGHYACAEEDARSLQPQLHGHRRPELEPGQTVTVTRAWA